MGDLADLAKALDGFEKKLEDRWQRTINDAVRAMQPWTPPPVHYRGNYARSPYVWEHRKPEVQAHITYGCQALEWFDAGRNGKPQSVSCHGKIRDPGSGANQEVWWHDATVIVDHDTIDCGIAGLFALAEEWAGKDRDWVSGLFPRWVDRNVAELKDSHDTLVQMSVDFGGTLDGPGAGGYQKQLTLSDEVEELFVNRDDEKGWRVDWTGTAAERASEGFFASTKPTLANHARLSLSIATLVNERAKIIDTYRKNGVELVRSATSALGEQAEDSTDHTAKWQTVQAAGMAGAIAPTTAYVGAALILVGWLGEKLLGISKERSFKYHPGDVANQLYEMLLELNEDLDTSEQDYVQDAREFRSALNEVPSTFLELYDLTENDPSGKH